MEKPTFKEAIQRFVHVGEVYFRGHYHDNVLNIFNELSEDDRKVLLRYLYIFYTLVEKGAVEHVTVESSGRRSEPAEEVEAVNKMTASSALIIVMLVFCLVVMAMLFIIVGTDSNPNSAFKTLFKVIGFFF